MIEFWNLVSLGVREELNTQLLFVWARNLDRKFNQYIINFLLGIKMASDETSSLVFSIRGPIPIQLGKKRM